MNIVPRLEVPPPDRPLPSDDPTPATAGSSITISAIRCCSFSIAWNEMSGDARVAPITKPESSVGK